MLDSDKTKREWIGSSTPIQDHAEGRVISIESMISDYAVTEADVKDIKETRFISHGSAREPGQGSQPEAGSGAGHDGQGRKEQQEFAGECREWLKRHRNGRWAGARP